MPAILSISRFNLTSFQLSGLPFWRIEVGVAGDRECLAFALLGRYPPGTPTEVVSLLKATVPFARAPAGDVQTARLSAEALGRVTAVALEVGTLDGDEQRTKEAFNIYKNNSDVRAEDLDNVVEEALKVVRAYWQVRLWVEQGCDEAKDFDREQLPKDYEAFRLIP